MWKWFWNSVFDKSLRNLGNNNRKNLYCLEQTIAAYKGVKDSARTMVKKTHIVLENI